MVIKITYFQYAHVHFMLQKPILKLASNISECVRKIEFVH